MRVVNRKTERGTHYIGRGSLLGNPFTHLPLRYTKALVKVDTREESITRYEEYARAKLVSDKDFMQVLYELPEDAVLECYCKPASCHGDVVMKLWEELHRVG